MKERVSRASRSQVQGGKRKKEREKERGAEEGEPSSSQELALKLILCITLNYFYHSRA